MLPFDQWNEVLSKLRGTVFRDAERLPSAAVLDALQVGGSQYERANVAKRVVATMRQLGWSGPKAIRFADGSMGSGYWRIAGALPTPLVEDHSELTDVLPAALEELTRESIKKLHRIVRLPLDPRNAGLLRAQVTSALGAVGLQLRADESRMRSKREGDTIARLEKLIAEQKRLLPKAVDPPTGPSLDLQAVESSPEGVPDSRAEAS
jgi:hypothetical protein